MNKIKFIDWFENNLTVGGFPYRVNSRFDASKYDIVINVSDEWYIDLEEQMREAGLKTYWFPMNEVKKDIGINSIYGAVVVLNRAEGRNQRVYLHCHMGVKRSEIIRSSYYFMRTNKQLVTDDATPNMLEECCTNEYLPPLKEMESFLGNVASHIKNMQGGILDSCKLKSITNF